MKLYSIYYIIRENHKTWALTILNKVLVVPSTYPDYTINFVLDTYNY